MGAQADKVGSSNMAYNPNFSWKRKTVTITKGTDLPAGYQVKLTIPKETEMQSDFRDLRFETTDGYGLPHWLETIVSTTATVWVKLKDALTSPTTSVDIYMYYGDPYVSSASNGTNTFDFFDDFDSYPDGNLNGLGGWTGNTDYKVQSVIAYKGKAIRSTLAITDVISHSITPIDKGIFSVYMRLDSYESMSTYLSSGATKTYEVSLYANPANVTYLSTTNPVTDFSPSVPRNYNQWYKIDIAFDTVADQYAYIKVDNSIKVTNAATISGGNIDKITLGRGGTAAGCNWDIVVLRKYVTTEPATPTIGATATIVNWNPQRKPITINNTSGSSLTDYQVKLTIPFAPEMNNDFSDLRFASSDGTSLSYWLESSTPGQTANIWIKTNLATGANIVYMHYGNPNLASVSNGINTFYRFNSGNISGWDNITSNWTNSGDYLKNTGTTYQTARLNIDINDYIVEAITQVPTTGYQYVGIFARRINQDADTASGIMASIGGNTGLYSMWNGNGWLDTGSNTSISVNTDYAVKLVLVGSTVTYYADTGQTTATTQRLTTSSASVTSGAQVGFASNVQANHLYKNFRVRKYIASEPIITTAAAEPMNTFSNRKTLTINNSSGSPLTDYQVPITVAQTPSIQTDFDDIRFVDSSGNLLPYWIESITGTTPNQTANVWIKTNLSTGNNTAYMYYGNANLTSASDGTNTFIFFDDFNSESLDTTKWTTSGTPVTSNGKLLLNNSDAIRSVNTYGAYNVAIRTYQKALADSSKRFGFSSITVGTDMQTSVDSAHYIFQPDGHQYSRTVINSSFTQIDNGSYSTNYVTREILWLPGNVKFLTGGSLTSEHTTNIPTSSLYLQLQNLVDGISDYEFDYVLIRKYASPEPTVGTAGTEETITATSMTITPTENPCRIGICTVGVSVTWTNTGENVSLFIPSIIVDSTTYSLSPVTLVTGDNIIAFSISGLPVGSHAICPYPN